jgi:hypothetical protein
MAPDQEIFLLPVVDGNSDIKGLALRPVHGRPGYYCRIGTFSFRSYEVHITWRIDNGPDNNQPKDSSACQAAGEARRL